VRRRYVSERSGFEICCRMLASRCNTAIKIGRGPEFHARACELSLEGIIAKRADAPYCPGDRRLWMKVKYQNR
jgi:ATP-dependent DNA ligase